MGRYVTSVTTRTVFMVITLGSVMTAMAVGVMAVWIVIILA
jgi:hypothetical protein